MKKYFLLLMIAVSLLAGAQHGNRIGKDNNKLLANDSILAQLRRNEDSIKKVLAELDANQLQERINRNADGLLQLQKDMRAKQKKAAMIRIGIGVALLAVLVIGLMRKRKKKK